jgi:hypothetical protein
LVVRPVDHAGDTSYALTNDLRQTGLAALARLKQRRHAVEQLFQEGKGEVGLGHYEVRSWVGWHHHMTLSLLALWYLLLERRAVGEKKRGGDGAVTAPAASRVVGANADTGGPVRGGQRHRPAHGGGPHLPLAPHQQPLSTAAR